MQVKVQISRMTKKVHTRSKVFEICIFYQKKNSLGNRFDVKHFTKIKCRLRTLSDSLKNDNFSHFIKWYK